MLRLVDEALKRAMVDQASAKKTVTTKPTSDQEQPEIVMIKHILLLAAVVGFIAQSSAFAAAPTPSPSPSAGAAKTPAKTHHHYKTHHKKSSTAPAAAPSPTPS